MEHPQLNQSSDCCGITVPHFGTDQRIFQHLTLPVRLPCFFEGVLLRHRGGKSAGLSAVCTKSKAGTTPVANKRALSFRRVNCSYRELVRP